MKRFLLTIPLVLIIGVAVGQTVVAEVRTYGGQYFDEGRDIIEVPDGYLVVGTSASTDDGNTDVYVVKLNDDLTIAWQQVLGGSAAEQGRSTCLASNGDYLILGQTAQGPFGGYDLMVYRLTPDGELLWERHYGTNDWDLAVRIVKGVNLYYIAATTSGFSPGESKQWMFRINDNGDFIDGTSFDILPEAQVNDLIWYNNALYMMGTRQYANGAPQGVLRRLTPSGAVVWEHVLDSTAFMGIGIAAGPSGLAASYSKRNAVLEDSWNFFLVGFDFDGNTLYSNGENANIPGDEIPRAVTIAGDVSIQVGTTGLFGAGGLGCRVQRLNFQGIFQSAAVFGGFEDEEPWRVIYDSMGRIVFVGNSNSYGNEYPDLYLVRLPTNVVELSYQLDLVHDITENPFTWVEEEDTVVQLPWPNPSTRWVNLPAKAKWYRIEDVSGRTLFSGNEVRIDFTGFAQGSYLVRWSDGASTYIDRIVIE